MRLACVLCTILVAAGCSTPASTQERPQMNQPSPQSVPAVQRFIVKYRPDSEAGRDSAAVAETLARTTAQAGLAGTGDAPLLRWERRLGVGADLVVSTRPLDPATARRLLQALNDDPGVEYAEPDGMMQRGPGPDVRGPDIRGD